jgi:hypothetical protein
MLGVPGDDREKPEPPLLSDYEILKRLDEDEDLDLIEKKLDEASKIPSIIDVVIEMNRIAQTLREKDSLHQLTDEYREVIHNHAIRTVHAVLSKLGKRDILFLDYDLKTEGENISLSSRNISVLERPNSLQMPKVEGVATVSHSLKDNFLDGRVSEHVGEYHIFSYEHGTHHFSTTVYSDFKTRDLKVAVTRTPPKTH